MANPETLLERELPQPIEHAVTATPEQLDAANFQETGIHAIPAHPQSVTDDNGQIIAQTSDPTQHSQADQIIHQVKVAMDEPTAEHYAKGNINDSVTWSGVFVLRQIKIALSKGWQLVVGNPK